MNLPIGKMNQMLNAKQGDAMICPVVLVGFKQTTINEAQRDSRFASFKLVYADFVRLYEIVMDENEGFDGEAVEVPFMVKCMYARYMAVGLTPSRN